LGQSWGAQKDTDFSFDEREIGLIFMRFGLGNGSALEMEGNVIWRSNKILKFEPDGVLRRNLLQEERLVL
jgi:hypothetical protein